MEAWNNGSKGLGFEEEIGFKGKLRSWDGTGAVPYDADVITVRYSEKSLTNSACVVGFRRILERGGAWGSYSRGTAQGPSHYGEDSI